MTKPRVICTRKWPEAVEAVLQERFDVTLNAGDAAMSPAALKQAFDDYDAVCPTVTDKIRRRGAGEPRGAPRSAAISGSGSTISTWTRPRRLASR